MNSREMPPQKRVRGGRANGIPKTARSATKLGLATSLWPGSRNREPIMNQSSRGVEQRGSQPRIRRDFTIDPRWTADLGGGVCGCEGDARHRQHGTGAAAAAPETYFEIPKDFKTGYQALLVATQATGHAERFVRSSADSVPMPSSRSGAHSSGTATAWRRTRSRSTSARIAGISSCVMTRANGTAKIGPPSASE